MGLKLTCREAVFLLEAPGEDLFPAPRGHLHASAQVPITLTSAFTVTSPLTLTLPLPSYKETCDDTGPPG